MFPSPLSGRPSQRRRAGWEALFERVGIRYRLPARQGLFENLSKFEKLPITRRFSEEHCAHFGRTLPILGRVGGRCDYNRDLTELCARPQTLQHFVAVFLRQVEVEQYQIRGWSLGFYFGLLDKGHRQFAVRRDVNFKGKFLDPDHFANQQRVGKIVFSHQKIEQSRYGRAGRAWGR